MITGILENLGVLFFCGILSLFIFPLLFERIIYTLPHTIHLSATKKIRWKSVKQPAADIIFVLCVLFFFFLIAFLYDPEIYLLLLTSNISYICWAFSSLLFAVRFIRNYSEIQNNFNKTIYTRFER